MWHWGGGIRVAPEQLAEIVLQSFYFTPEKGLESRFWGQNGFYNVTPPLQFLDNISLTLVASGYAMRIEYAYFSYQSLLFDISLSRRLTEKPLQSILYRTIKSINRRLYENDFGE